MRIEIHAVPLTQEGHSFLQVLSPVEVVLPTGPDSHKRVRVKALWDTGATHTCIPMKLAVAMGIPLGEPTPVDKMKTTEQSRYCKLWLQFPTGEALFVPEAVAVPNMRAKFVIGMDVISKGTTTIEPDGNGGVRFTYIR